MSVSIDLRSCSSSDETSANGSTLFVADGVLILGEVLRLGAPASREELSETSECDDFPCLELGRSLGRWLGGRVVDGSSDGWVCLCMTFCAANAVEYLLAVCTEMSRRRRALNDFMLEILLMNAR